MMETQEQNTQIPVLFYREGTCSLGALITLLWLDRPFYLCRMEKSDDGDDPNFLALNALGEVPLLFLNGIVLTENIAILQHLGLQDLEKKIAFAPGTPEFDQLNRALAFLGSDFHKSFHPVFGAESLSADKKVQAEIIKRTVEGRLKEMFQHVNDHLLKRKFIDSDHPMITDAYLFAMARWGEDLYETPKLFPRLYEFQSEMKKDKGVQMALAIESGDAKDQSGSFLGHVEFKPFAKEAAKLKLQEDDQKANPDFKPGLKTETKTTTSVGQEKKSGAI